MSPGARHRDDAVTCSVVVPVYNSAAMLPDLHRRLVAVLEGLGRSFELIFVEDCGPDDSWSVLSELAARDDRVLAIQLMRNSGQGAATFCGLHHARGALIVTMDDDLQHPPEELPALIAALEAQAHVDVVMGQPRITQHHLIRRLGSRGVHRLNSLMLGMDPSLHLTSFRVMRRAVVEGMLQMRTLHPALGPMIQLVTRRIVNVQYAHAPRAAGRSSYTFRRIARQMLANFMGYSMLPLRLLAVVGMIGILLSMALAVTLVVRWMAGGVVPGWTSLALLTLVLSGFSFFAFAILGEYILHINQLVASTPQYIERARLGRAGRARSGGG